jgi:tyrosine-specific transport protein
MSVKFIALIVAVILIMPFVHLERLAHFYHSSIATAITVVITAYGFSIVIPSLRDYYHSDVVKLRKIVFYGSLIPLACYLIWVAVVLGVLPLTGDHSLINILHSSDPNTQLTQALSYYSNSSGLLACTRIFASICLATTFLGVSLSLVDFLADGFKLDKKGKQGYLLYSLTFVPPVLIVLCYPAAFIMALSYAGVFCTILMIILPAMMVWRGRYQQKLASTYQVMGGKPALIATFVIGVLVVILPFA